MKERPIIFSGPMVRAILDGKKTQTRRVLKPQPKNYIIQSPDDGLFYDAESINAGKLVKCPFGAIGDRLWVRETWQQTRPKRSGGRFTLRTPQQGCGDLHYTASTETFDEEPPKWRSPRFMPRWASRLTLEITDVRVQWLQGITLKDVAAEGVADVAEFIQLWDNLNYLRGHGWSSNPWVWVIAFRRSGDEIREVDGR